MMPSPRSISAWFSVPLLIAVGVAVTAAQPARAPGITVLAKIAPGEWQWRDRADTNAAPRNQCVADPAELLQMRHPGAVCSRFVIDNGDRSTTIHYTCPGAGHGRTVIQLSQADVLRVDSQGIAANAPFDFSIEGRRVGACNGTH